MQPTLYRLTEIHERLDAFAPYAHALVGRTFRDVDLVPASGSPGWYCGHARLVGDDIDLAYGSTIGGELYFFRAKFEAISET
jgi:hypothetical protein